MNERKAILQVKELETSFFTDDGVIPAVIILTFHVQEGEILGIVGESGCGKSVTSLIYYGACTIVLQEKLQMVKFYLEVKT